MKRVFLLSIAAAMLAAASVRAADKNPIVIMETSAGTIKIELYQEKAPITVKNFLGYVDDKFYDGTIFHRVIGKPGSKKDFMVQGGGFEPGMKEKKVKDPIKNEASNGLSNERGTLAMARTPESDSATAQFFINLVHNAGLDKENTDDKVGYCVFGRVLEGMDVVDKIKAVKVKNIEENGRVKYDNVPLEDVVIKSIKRAEK
jgi:cyclophilin family peptidyl-prolyl cis-trans isomerase